MDIFEEVKEDLERERYSKLWWRYGYILVAAAIIAIMAASVNAWWQVRSEKQQEEIGNMFQRAITAVNKNEQEEAIKLFDAVAIETKGEAATLALLRKAAVLSGQGKNNQALAVYESIMNGKGGDQVLAELASLLSSYLYIETGQGEKSDALLEELSKEGSAWRASAIELKAVRALQKGNRAQAKELFAILAKGEETPASIKTRAAEMVTSLE